MVESRSIDSSVSSDGRILGDLLTFEALRIAEERDPLKAEVSLLQPLMAKTLLEVTKNLREFGTVTPGSLNESCGAARR